MSPPKSCAVCGDKALGYNFNAVTCESCKAFFRRNALAKKQFTCPFNQNCEITVVTRRFCQKCRLKKCLDIGMKSENIMSEEDKLIKRRKIENNRVKRRLNEKKQAAADSTGFDTTSHDSQSSYDSGKGTGTVSAACVDANHEVQPSSSTATPTLAVLDEPLHDVNPELMSGKEMVDFIVSDPDRASQAINKLMRTPKEAMSTLEKIINSQKDALRLISHLIAYPGDALKIISKIMNSPFNALTVFTKFMSSPTDALEIISKIVSSPQDVLQFIKNLMDCPEDALDIMNKFMNTPAEALRIINKLFNGTTPAANTNINELLQSTPTTMDTETLSFHSAVTPQSQIYSPPGEVENPNTLIYSMLNSSPNSTHGTLQPPSQQSLSAATQTAKAINKHATTPSRIAMSPFTPSPQAMSIGSPLSVATSDMQYHSPASIPNDELPSTSAGLIAASSSPPPHATTMTTPTTTDITTDATDFASEHFDIKTFIQNSIPDHTGASDSLNSLESVLTEVIRIEFQAFNNLPQEPRVKQEQHHHRQQHAIHTSQQQQHCGYIATGDQLQQQQQHSICAPSIVIMGRDLNEAEQMKLRELKLASEALFYPVDEDLSIFMMGDDRIKHEDTRQDPKLLQVINLTAVAIKRLIKMAKKITAFRDMCQEDQVALLKGGCTEMMIMRSVMTYDDDRNTWKIPHKKDSAHIRAEVLKLAKGNVYEEHLKFIRTFHEKWRMDENIILIMMAILLFMPTRQRIIHSDVIRLEQNSYYYLLRRYLESVYPGCEAKSAFIKLIEKISDVERLNQVIIGVYLNVNPSLVEPLLREIFDLKNH